MGLRRHIMCIRPEKGRDATANFPKLENAVRVSLLFRISKDHKVTEMTIGFQDMLDQANANVETIAADKAIALLALDDVVFVDIRDVRELERDGTIPGAYHCPRGMLEFWVHPDSPYHKPLFAEDKRFVFYCASGWRSALSTAAMQRLGLSNVAHIGGGFSSWKAAGGPVAQKEKRHV